MLLGKIIKSNSHIDYICQVYNPGEVPNSPPREAHTFGEFVQIDLGNGRWIVGVIYNSMLFNPEFGRFGPRLSPETELAVFSPDYLDEKTILLGIIAVGLMGNTQNAVQGVPPITANSDALVTQMSNEQIQRFHQPNSRLQASYLTLIHQQNLNLANQLILVIGRRLITLFPNQQVLLNVLQDYFAWKTQISPLGES